MNIYKMNTEEISSIAFWDIESATDFANYSTDVIGYFTIEQNAMDGRYYIVSNTEKNEQYKLGLFIIISQSWGSSQEITSAFNELVALNK